jgi:hypothetical protein
MYEGSDSYEDFAENGGPDFIDEFEEVERNGVPDPLRPGVVLRVKIVHAHDGAARHELTGCTSPASKHCIEYNTMTGDESRDLRWLGPLTRTAESMKAAEPGPGLSDAQRQSRARLQSVAGIRGANLLRISMCRLLVEMLHVLLRLTSTTLQNSARVIVQSKGDVTVFAAHIRECLGVKARVLWIGDRGIEVCVSGNEVRKLLAAGSKIIACTRGHAFLPATRQGSIMREELADLWQRAQRVLYMFAETDVDKARLTQASLQNEALLFGLISTELFGPRAVTPTFRILVDIAPSQQRVRSEFIRLSRCLHRPISNFVCRCCCGKASRSVSAAPMRLRSSTGTPAVSSLTAPLMAAVPTLLRPPREPWTRF